MRQQRTHDHGAVQAGLVAKQVTLPQRELVQVTQTRYMHAVASQPQTHPITAQCTLALVQAR